MDRLERDINKTVHFELYQNPSLRQYFGQVVSNKVNQRIAPLSIAMSDQFEHNLATLREQGYLILGDFFSSDDVAQAKALALTQKGYNAHLPVFSDGIARSYDKDYPFGTLSYKPQPFLTNPMLLEHMTHPALLALVQAYLGCFPTLYSLSCWWHRYMGETTGTQVVHRDHDDFRFLALFVYLTDVDTQTGAHVFYPRTHNGEAASEEVIITGKAGTAILADTYALHKGMPLERDERLVLWWRYGLSINQMHYSDGNDAYAVNAEELFKRLPATEHNRYLLRGFTKP